MAAWLISFLVASFAIAATSAETICYGQDPSCAAESTTCVEATANLADSPGKPECVEAAKAGLFQTYSTFIKTDEFYSINVYMDADCTQVLLTTDLGEDVCTEVVAPMTAPWYVVVSGN
ncbi:hypothetical protein SARC_01599 [Sphaeroforma arctica JP610]|uniref:Uncharacterized protein n=1 Tax=Sphaeroforma arctica JP610 TaxID=667725 RepID=A0A0L0GB81_9EUKA|nr:hypothetical protein SARC_01599 [Sphaeroforma arctica JP610]KNC86277.1 hypothetical protein SARC_01599 [Sphaeroforma arctica JP610]|eukprot:XP_014160179.1 hypothetical protein SARC_01599 [Sphaeroforma arctica JP610]